ncbi:hypothetical protein CLV51_103486 [Chitinophaga niastensis]|uniref:DUF4064 domain-containing protein n=1 Tax=Chitinophaga niastensis TaxID=536980 RepID=A0A2P8HJW0_CHINA|nr:DUF6463 family protein [Chitinophaga niastensis]PSL46506.1 hypothetical protein CLV51_103486 [Chitinophaga niastensis]
MKNPWIGKTLIGIAIIHTMFGLVVFRDILGQLYHDGLLNTIKVESDRNAAFWFLFTGFVWILLGIFVNSAEKNQYTIPPVIGWSLLVTALLAVIIMPASGFWLLFIPAIALIKRNKP